MSSPAGYYSRMTASPVKRDFAKLNLRTLGDIHYIFTPELVEILFETTLNRFQDESHIVNSVNNEFSLAIS